MPEDFDGKQVPRADELDEVLTSEEAKLTVMTGYIEPPAKNAKIPGRDLDAVDKETGETLAEIEARIVAAVEGGQEPDSNPEDLN
ncbi:hypothetical protein HOG17_04500 [Candidatus Peregrinibacteria bacterium]|jgi:hypothetical protein|nr:hypothetical protein [Candidatus Peregrinibacteria bacterium]MBT4147826.1 hypothetical protein [Candidatus Peregrinibacteria bacterium]MBT4366069.1 hypothetical protein [Candidatus Peregrinibacteria bacterium]MBT4455572.1 hypothetical protein [Candidatus Peregrinibacteria bacterium]